MEPVVALSKEIEDLALALVSALPRAHAFFGASQVLGATVLPGVPRIAVILALLFFMVPVQLDWAHGFDRSLTAFALLFCKEYAIGFLLGTAASVLFWAMQAAGDLIDNQRGTAIAASADPLRGEEASSLGALLTLAFTTYVFVSGSMLMLIGVLYHSFLVWPVGRAAPVLSGAFPVFMLALLDEGMRLTFLIAAPVVAVMFVAEFSLAIVSRFAPQVQVFVLAMPIKSLLGVATLILYIAFLYPFADRQFNELPKLSERLFAMFRAGDAPAPLKERAP